MRLHVKDDVTNPVRYGQTACCEAAQGGYKETSEKWCVSCEEVQLNLAEDEYGQTAWPLAVEIPILR